MDKILEYLYLGSYKDSLNTKSLDAQGITHILDLMDSPHFRGIDGRNTQSLPVSDDGHSDLSKTLGVCKDVIGAARDAGGTCLIHCTLGNNVAPSLVTLYLMDYYAMSLDKAFNYVRHRRRMYAPHEVYLRQMQDFDVSLFGELSLNERVEPLSLQAIARRLLRENR